MHTASPIFILGFMKNLIIFLAAIAVPSQIVAQSYENTMLFGYQGGHYSPNNPEGGINILKFDEGSLQISDNQLIDMWFNDTNAAISDSSGNLLFYFNGVYLEDISRKIMENGDTLNTYVETGYDLPQGAIIIPYPGHSNQYILFHGEDGYVDIPGWSTECIGMYYSIIDMTLSNGLGAVVQRKVPLAIDTIGYGKLTLTRHANGRDWWLVINRSHSNQFYTILIDPYGIHIIGLQTIGPPRNYEGIGQAYFSPDGSKYVNYHSIGATIGQYADVYNFDRCTGQLGNHQHIYIEDGGGGAIISPNSHWLYIPTWIYLYKYDLWSDSIAGTQELIALHDGFLDPFPTYFHRGFPAPDDKIYIVTTSGSRSLHVIHKPDESGTDCAFEQHGIRLPCYNSTSIPTYANYRLGPLDGSSCDTLGIDNDPVSWWRYEQDTLDPLAVEFRDLSYHGPETWAWDFGDGGISTERHPYHDFDNTGIYQVCLTVSNVNGSNTHCKTLYIGVSATDNPVLQKQITISPNPFYEWFSVSLSATLPSPIFRLYDMAGLLVRKERIAFGINEIEANELNSGIYFWEVISNKELIKAGKIIKMDR